MAHLLHIDSSVQGERSVSRRLTARAAAAWRAAHTGGTVTYRDLGASPLPHLTNLSVFSSMVPEEDRTPEQAAAYAVSEEIINEVKRADTVLLGLPLYNYGPPSSVKSWVDHLVARGLSFDAETREPLLGGRDFLVVASRGGGYGVGTPREGWDHAEQWLTHGVSATGLEPHFITAELTLAPVNPAMSDFVPMFEKSLAAAERAVDDYWASAAV